MILQRNLQKAKLDLEDMVGERLLTIEEIQTIFQEIGYAMEKTNTPKHMQPAIYRPNKAQERYLSTYKIGKVNFYYAKKVLEILREMESEGRISLQGITNTKDLVRLSQKEGITRHQKKSSPYDPTQERKPFSIVNEDALPECGRARKYFSDFGDNSGSRQWE